MKYDFCKGFFFQGGGGGYSMSFGAVADFWKHDLKINTCIFKTNISRSKVELSVNL